MRIRIQLRWVALVALLIAVIAWTVRVTTKTKDAFTRRIVTQRYQDPQPPPFTLPKFDTALYPIKFSLRLTNGITKKTIDKQVTVLSEQHAMAMLLAVLKEVWPPVKVVNNVVVHGEHGNNDLLISQLWRQYKNYPDAWKKWRLDTNPEKHAFTVAAIAAYEKFLPKALMFRYHPNMKWLLLDIQDALDSLGHKVVEVAPGKRVSPPASIRNVRRI